MKTKANMVKKIYFAAFAAVAILMGLTACSGSGDGNSSDPEPAVETVKANLTFNTEGNSDFNSICDFNVTYKVTDADGKVETKNTTVANTLTLSDIKCPCSIDLTYSYALKTDAVKDTVSYNVSFGPSIQIRTTNGTMKLQGSVMSLSYTGSGMKYIFGEMAKQEYQTTYTIDKDGNITTNNNGEESYAALNAVIISYAGSDAGREDKTAESKQGF